MNKLLIILLVSIPDGFGSRSAIVKYNVQACRCLVSIPYGFGSHVRQRSYLRYRVNRVSIPYGFGSPLSQAAEKFHCDKSTYECQFPMGLVHLIDFETLLEWHSEDGVNSLWVWFTVLFIDSTLIY